MAHAWSIFGPAGGRGLQVKICILARWTVVAHRQVMHALKEIVANLIISIVLCSVAEAGKAVGGKQNCGSSVVCLQTPLQEYCIVQGARKTNHS